MNDFDDVLIKALVPWFGSKRKMARRIARECCTAEGKAPKSFWELCAGSFAVSLAMPQCSHHNAVDLHGDLINLARVVADNVLGTAFYRRVRRIFNHEGLFVEHRDALFADDRDDGDAGLFAAEARAKLSPVDRAVAYFVVSWMGRNGVAGTERLKYQFAKRWTSGGGHNGLRFGNAVASIPAWRRRMRRISILREDIFKVLALLDDQEGTVVYIDPPYVRDKATRSGECAYLHDFRPADHSKLATAVSRFKKTRVVISYYDTPTLRELYAGWTFVECTTQKNLHVQNRRGEGQKDAPEVLIINGPSYSAEEAA